MKKFITALIMGAMFTPAVFAAEFVDYGRDSADHQCFNTECATVYSDDASLIGPKGFDTTMSSKLAQPNAPTSAERTARQKEVRRQICLIIGC